MNHIIVLDTISWYLQAGLFLEYLGRQVWFLGPRWAVLVLMFTGMDLEPRFTGVGLVA